MRENLFSSHWLTVTFFLLVGMTRKEKLCARTLPTGMHSGVVIHYGDYNRCGGSMEKFTLEIQRVIVAVVISILLLVNAACLTQKIQFWNEG